jgi:hypothetical protein
VSRMMWGGASYDDSGRGAFRVVGTRGEFGLHSDLALRGSGALSFGELIRGSEFSYEGDG